MSAPALEPLVVVAGDEVEPLLRSARASVAQLTLQLRSVVREAEDAETNDGAAARRTSPAGADDLASAEALLRSSVERRRRDMASELTRARHDAAEHVAAADREAAELVLAARSEMLAVLEVARGAERAAPPVPNLRIVGDAEPLRTATVIDAAPIAPSPPAVDHIEASVALPVVIEPEPSAPSVAVPRPTDDLLPAQRTSWSRYLYLDVVLPLLAAVLVVVVLLAWVG